MQLGNQWKNRTVGVLMGGLSAAKEISLQTGEAVYHTLVDRGYKARRVYVDRDLDMVLRQEGIEVAFLALQGRYGEDGCVQGLLEFLGVPYTGAGVLGSALAMNKVKAKEVLRLHNLPTPAYYVLEAHEADNLVARHGVFGFPAVVKPASLGASMGVSLVHSLHELRQAVDEALLFDSTVLVERFVEGMQVHVAVLGERVLGALELIPTDALYSFADKTRAGRCEAHVPARLTPTRYRGVLTQAAKAHRALSCEGLSLVDMIVSDSGNESILEVNSLPSLSSVSLVPRIAHAAGLSYGDLVEAVLNTARLKRGGLFAAETVAASGPEEGTETGLRVVGAAGPN